MTVTEVSTLFYVTMIVTLLFPGNPAAAVAFDLDMAKACFLLIAKDLVLPGVRHCQVLCAIKTTASSMQRTEGIAVVCLRP